jgi:hypothetical protein
MNQSYKLRLTRKEYVRQIKRRRQSLRRELKLYNATVDMDTDGMTMGQLRRRLKYAGES